MEINKTLPTGFITKHRAVFNDKYLNHFGIHEVTAMLYGDNPKDIIEVELEVAEDQTKPPINDKDMSVDYWGWYDHDSKEFSLIYAKKFLLDMCFPNIDLSEKADHGKAYRLKVVGDLYKPV